MNPKFNSKEMHEFFSNFEEKNPAYLLGLIIVSLGLYLFVWIYTLNRELERLDDDAPNSTRGAVLLIIFPFTWFFIMSYVKFLTDSIIIQFIEITIYILIYFLILKYIYELILSFSHITRTQPMLWFIAFIFGSLGVFGYYLQSYIIIALTLILVFLIPMMQSQLNITYHKISIKKTNFSFYGK